MHPIEDVYGRLILAYRNACVDGDPEKAKRIDAAIRAMEELWPDHCERYRAMFANVEKV